MRPMNALLIAILAAVVVLAGCGGPIIATPPIPAQNTANVVNTQAGKVSTALAPVPDQGEAEVKAIEAITATQPAVAAQVQPHLDGMRILFGVVRLAAQDMKQLLASTFTLTKQVQDVMAENTALRTDNATLNTRLQNYDHSWALAKAGSCVGLAVLFLGVVGLGIYFKNLYVIGIGAGLSALSFIGAILFMALAWCTEHPWIVGSALGCLLAGLIVAMYFTVKNKWLTFTTLNSGAKLLSEAIAANDMNKVKEAVASLRTDADFAKSWSLMVDPSPLTPAPAPVTPAVTGAAAPGAVVPKP